MPSDATEVDLVVVEIFIYKDLSLEGTHDPFDDLSVRVVGHHDCALSRVI